MPNGKSIEPGLIVGRVAVAYSGGRDSTALLHATLAAAEAQGIQVLALHVHHGLSPNADAWLARCEAQCRRWARAGRPVGFHAWRATGRPAPGQSVEAWARAQRYEALGSMAHEQGASIVLLAQHRNDQAETFLLQALRGAGVAGLSGMPERIERSDIVWCRPWLNRTRVEIDAYVRRHRLTHVDDDSNDDLRFDRNRLRHKVWPALIDAFPLADAALARAANWAQEAAAALDELAGIDLDAITVEPGADAESAASSKGGLNVGRWLALSAARRSNALRAWLKATLGEPASSNLVTRLLDELTTGRPSRWQTSAGELRVHREVLNLHRTPSRKASAEPAPVKESVLAIRRAGTYLLPGWNGRLDVRRVREGGVPLAWLGHLELRPRAGAEQFQAGLDRPPRSLKKQYQDANVAAWDRSGPLVYSGGQLVYVPGLGLDARTIGLPGQPLVALEWKPADPA